jgi:hypothetical protein
LSTEQGILLMSMIGDGRTDGLVRRAPRWVLRATLGESSDRGEPECFRPARTLREAPERGAHRTSPFRGEFMGTM